MPKEKKEAMFAQVAQKLLVKHVADPDEIAEAYLFLMKYVNFYSKSITFLACSRNLQVRVYHRAEAGG